VINRAVARLTLFEKESDYEAFDRVLALAYSRVPLPIYSYIVMPNHWHFVVQPQTDTQLTEFFRELLSEWPIPQPRTWVTMANRSQNEVEENAIRSV